MTSKNSQERFAIVSALAMLAAICLVSAIFYWLYSSAKQNIFNVWQSRNFHIAQEVGYYLRTPIDAVAFTAMKINGMLERGATNAEISKYLLDESEIYELIIEGNETGVYGYC